METTAKKAVKVSVIVPVYNVEQYLAECLDSLLNQTLKEIEIICIDDASTDNSARIMRDYAARDSRIKNIFLEQNSGCSHARNVAISQVTGEYVYYADADDMLKADAFSRLCEIADSNNLDQVLFLMDVIWECENTALRKSYCKVYPAAVVNHVYPGRKLFELLLDKTFFTAPWSKITRTDLVKRHNVLFTEGHVHSDNFYTAKTLIFADRAMAINERFYIRRVREDSITTATDADATIRHVCGFAAVVGELQIEIGQGIYTPDQQQVLHSFCSLLASSAMRRAQKLKGKSRKTLLERLAGGPWGTHWCFVMSALYRQWDQLKAENTALRKQLNSLSWRIMRALTWLPRNLYRGLCYLKKHGVKYTCNRIMLKIKQIFSK